MDDLISRQALCEYALNQKDKSITPNDIMRFPSAQPETHDKRTETHSCDLIDRQAAIDAIKTWGLIDGLAEGQAIEILADEEKLPSAQPEIVRCKDCKHHHYEGEDIPYCDRIDYGYGWKDDDFCSMAERRTNVDANT